jgi:hypothetical protein
MLASIVLFSVLYLYSIFLFSCTYLLFLFLQCSHCCFMCNRFQISQNLILLSDLARLYSTYSFYFDVIFLNKRNSHKELSFEGIFCSNFTFFHLLNIRKF